MGVQQSAKLNDKIFLPLIAILSVLVPTLVAVLLFVSAPKGTASQELLNFLPALNAGINFTVFILLILGARFIKKKMVKQHRISMVSAFVLSSIFLLSYVAYHSLREAGHVTYGGEGAIKYIYYFILLTHILLSVPIIPLSMLSIYRALKNQLDKHRKLVKFTLPIWLYVSFTGVIVYLMAHVFNPASPITGG